MNLFFSKMQWSSQQWNIPYFLKRRTTWNDLQQVRIDLKRPTKSKKRFGTTGNGLKQPRVSKKRHETTDSEQETTRNDLQKTDSNFMESLYLKNNQLEGSDVTNKQ